MARSDLLINLARAGSRGDHALFRRTLEAMVAEERAKQHNVLADRLSEYVGAPGNGLGKPATNSDERVSSLLSELLPARSLENLVLGDRVLAACTEVIEEQQRADLLRSYNLEPRHRILLIGPPGNGKTSLAEAMANAMMVPLYVVRYDGVIGSYLGETAARMARLFDYVRSRQCVLFLDEFDSLAKERGDVHETGEIKRVVSSLLLQVDALPSYVVVICATNHSELLDRAVWRRFQLRLCLEMPTKGQRVAWIDRFAAMVNEPLGLSPRTIAEKLGAVSFAELEEFSADILRRYALTRPDLPIRTIIEQRLVQWKDRARIKGGQVEED